MLTEVSLQNTWVTKSPIEQRPTGSSNQLDAAAPETPETRGRLIILTEMSSCPASTAANYCPVSEQSCSGS